MKQKELEDLKMKVYGLYGKNRGRKENELYKEVIELIRYTEELKRLIRDLAEIGSKHST
tara:strand:+ start:98 stop:274 length:177 start_codon:yes stop_codon:yes gene_type:complete